MHDLQYCREFLILLSLSPLNRCTKCIDLLELWVLTIEIHIPLIVITLVLPNLISIPDVLLFSFRLNICIDVVRFQSAILTKLKPKIESLLSDPNDKYKYKRNLIKLEVYFEEFNVERISERKAYPVSITINSHITDVKLTGL